MNIYKFVCTSCGQITKAPKVEKSICGACKRSDTTQLISADKVTHWRQLLDW